MWTIDQVLYNSITSYTGDFFYTTVFSFASHVFDPLIFSCIFILTLLTLYRYLLKKEVVWFGVTILSAVVVTMVLKHLTGVTRPVTAFPFETSPSFPSGHTTVATAYFIALIHFFRRDKNRARRILHMCFCILFATFVGVSRLYLEVHWLSDVLAGYVLGGLIVYISIHIYKIKY